MAFEVKTFRLLFMWNGKQLIDVVQAWSSLEARRLVEQRYPGATTFTVSQI